MTRWSDGSLCVDKDSNVKDEGDRDPVPDIQLDMFTDYAAKEAEQVAAEKARERERRQQEVVLEIKAKWGKNAILKGMNLEDGATAKQRNEQVGGHRA